ncbi:MmgE/PrpD family protein [Variovorax sp. J22R24]|uniref:MmgE/PrpD family protein n=1 Tax=Variovorax gracilis TaxID=3053502 RepID=UPI002578EFC8|nr:MmgE/PrpD family protein [Variovorax sp. J22R24]MDM0106584.1 MmgE/PrpD family protein [Variovorax sp. J22R24]
MSNDVANSDNANASGVTSAVVERAARLYHGEHTDDALMLGKQCMLDWFGVALAGAKEPLVQMLVAQAEEEGSSAVATVLQRKMRYSARQAALINGAMGHAIDYDDTIVAGLGHMTAAVLPAALAAAETNKKSGARLLAAFVAGYEAAVMVGRFVGMDHYNRGFHGTATIGAFGAASAAGLLMDLEPEALARALGIAGTQAAGLKGQFATMCKPLHAGKASENGLFGAQLARRGFTSRLDILECSQGFAFTQSSGGDTEAALAPASGGAHISENLFKFSAACYGTHGAISAARRLRDEHNLVPDQIRRVVLRVEPGADSMCNIAAPETGLQAKFSLRFNTALALFGEDTSLPSTYTDELTQRADLCSLRDRIAVRPMQRGWPMCLTEVDVELNDGRLLQASCDTGMPATDLVEQGRRLHDKFGVLASDVIGQVRAKQLAEAIDHVDQIPDIRELLEIVR